MKILLAFLAQIALVLTLPRTPVTDPEKISTCGDVIAKAGLNPNFASSVAHRLHSLTVEDIRYYFDRNAPERVAIPTVNQDLSSPIRVLSYVPVSGHDTTFLTPGLRDLDRVMRHLKEFSITNYSNMEMVAHAMHMSELWTHASRHYATYMLMPPSPELCKCFRDTENNGILQELHLLALKIKYPGITSGDYDPSAPIAAGYKLGYKLGYTLGYKLSLSSKETQRLVPADFYFGGNEADVVKRVAEELVDGDKGLDKGLEDDGGWESWREGFKSMPESGNQEFAMFMYCSLN